MLWGKQIALWGLSKSQMGCYLWVGRDPFNQNFRKFRSKTQWIGSVQPEKFRNNWSTFWGGPLFPVGPVWILDEWIAPSDVSLRYMRFPIQISRESWSEQTEKMDEEGGEGGKRKLSLPHPL